MGLMGPMGRPISPMSPIDFKKKFFPVFVPEGHRILAGGETTGTGCDRNPRPGRTPDQSPGLAPFQGWESFGAHLPVVSPPANITQRGAKEHFLECYISPIPAI